MGDISWTPIAEIPERLKHPNAEVLVWGAGGAAWLVCWSLDRWGLTGPDADDTWVGDITHFAEINPPETQPRLRTPADIPTGFIPWHGGSRPVSSGASVDLFWADGDCEINELAGSHSWQHTGTGEDIVGYRTYPAGDE